MSSSPSNPLIAHPVSEKLTRANHAIWEAHVRAAMRGSRLIGHLTGTTPVPEKEIADADGKKTSNPAFEEWDARDQQVLSYLLSSISKEILVHVSRSETAADAWRKIQAMFASQTRARAVNLRIALSTTKKGSMNVAEYFAKMKGYADDMAAAGRPLEDDELVEYIITGLDRDFTSLVSALVARVEPISVEELYSQMLSYETRMDLIHEGEQQASANLAGRGGRSRGPGRGRGRARPPSRGYSGAGVGGQDSRGAGGQGHGPGGQDSHTVAGKQRGYRRSSGDPCQVCFKKGHTAVNCWHRFDESYVPEERHAAAATSSYTVDTNWYADSGATDHITGELEKLSIRDKYNGGDQIHTASGTGMEIVTP